MSNKRWQPVFPYRLDSEGMPVNYFPNQKINLGKLVEFNPLIVLGTSKHPVLIRGVKMGDLGGFGLGKMGNGYKWVNLFIPI